MKLFYRNIYKYISEGCEIKNLRVRNVHPGYGLTVAIVKTTNKNWITVQDFLLNYNVK